MTSIPHVETGTVVGGYRIDAIAGQGGMGVVYRATQLGLDRVLGNGIAGMTAADHVRRRHPLAEIDLVADEPHHLSNRMGIARLIYGCSAMQGLFLNPDAWYHEHAVTPGLNTRALDRPDRSDRRARDRRVAALRPVDPRHRLALVRPGDRRLRRARQLRAAHRRRRARPARLAQRTGAVTAAVEGDGRVRMAHLADGRGVEADVVLAAAGITPNSELARAAGLAVNRGVLVDERMRTQDHAILAARDVAEH